MANRDNASSAGSATTGTVHHRYYYRPHARSGSITQDATTTDPRTGRTTVAGSLVRIPATDTDAADRLTAGRYERVTRQQAIRAGLYRPWDAENVDWLESGSDMVLWAMGAETV